LALTRHSLRALGFEELTDAALDLLIQCASDVLELRIGLKAMDAGPRLIEVVESAQVSRDDEFILRALQDSVPDYRQIVFDEEGTLVALLTDVARTLPGR
jgi:hypothetical protein